MACSCCCDCSCSAVVVDNSLLVVITSSIVIRTRHWGDEVAIVLISKVGDCASKLQQIDTNVWLSTSLFAAVISDSLLASMVHVVLSCFDAIFIIILSSPMSLTCIIVHICPKFLCHLHLAVSLLLLAVIWVMDGLLDFCVIQQIVETCFAFL